MLGHTGAREALGLIIVRAGQIREGIKLAVVVIQKVGDQAIDRPVRLLHFRTPQIGVKADFMEQSAEAVDGVGFLQAVEAVQHHAQLVKAVFRQLLAALAGGGAVVDIGAGSQIPGKDHALPVEVKALGQVRRGEEIRDRLQRDQVQAVLPDKVNAVVPQTDFHGVAEALEGFRADLLQDRRFAVVVEAFGHGQIQDVGGHGQHAEQVIVLKPQDAAVKIDGHRDLRGVGFVRPRDRYDGVLRGYRELAFEKHPQQRDQVVDLHIGQVADAVQEVELHLHARVHAVGVKGERAFADLMRPGGKGRCAERQQQRQRQQKAHKLLRRMLSIIGCRAHWIPSPPEFG